MNTGMLLAPLRMEIELLPGPMEDDGSPTGILYDALNETYDKFGWAEGEILSRLRRPVSLDALYERLKAETTLNVQKSELVAFLHSLSTRGLLQGTPSPSGNSKTGGVIGWLLTHVLFFKLPLVWPDAFLKKTLWLPHFFGSRLMLWSYLIVAALALLLLIPRSGLLLQSTAPFLTWGGALWLGAAVIAVKGLHELGHAYAAAVRGIPVRSMGIFFMVLTPIPYCDVTDSWRLPRKERLAISFAGVKVELVLAAFCLFCWCLAGPGHLRDIFMTVSTASVITTLLTNLNPGMRFDGYYLFADCIGVDNLQQTAFTEARAFFRRTLLGLSECRGNHNLGRRKRTLLVAYAVYVCIYRLFVYFGIALLVYHFFPKAVGIILFLVEVAAFIIRPVARELMETTAMLRTKRPSPRLIIFLILCGLVFLWLVLPLPRNRRLEAVVASSDIITLYAPVSGRVAAPAPVRGEIISAGTVILSLESQELENEIRENELKYDSAILRLHAARAGADALSRLQPVLAEAARLSSVLSSLRAQEAQQRMVAESDLLVVEVDEQYVPGNHVAKRTRLAKFMPPDTRPAVVAYLPEDFLGDVQEGESAIFASNAAPGEKIPVTITKVMLQSSREIEEPALIGPMGGALPVQRSAEGGYTPASPLYRIETTVENGTTANLRPGQTGTLFIHGQSRSLAWDLVKWLGRTFLKESGF